MSIQYSGQQRFDLALWFEVTSSIKITQRNFAAKYLTKPKYSAHAPSAQSIRRIHREAKEDGRLHGTSFRTFTLKMMSETIITIKIYTI